MNDKIMMFIPLFLIALTPPQGTAASDVIICTRHGHHSETSDLGKVMMSDHTCI
jgi:hypothetical protein